MLKKYIEDIKSRWVRYKYERSGKKYNEFMGFTNGDEITITITNVHNYMFNVLSYWNSRFIVRSGFFLYNNLPDGPNKFKMVIVGDDVILNHVHNPSIPTTEQRVDAIKLSRYLFYYYVRKGSFVINVGKKNNFIPIKQIKRFELHK
mgnify:CR=1|tara:strand:+ start:2249 stop:2689 length:441 start_codon:yes stop_codon:yes gene_type:complete